MSFVTINPKTGEILRVYHYQQVEEVFAVVDMLQSEQLRWRSTKVTARRLYLKQIAEMLLTNRQILSEILSLETGKTADEAVAEIEKSAFAFQFFSGIDEQELQHQQILTDYQFSYTKLVPLGIILAIMPWNYPLWQLTRVLAPAILLGNSVLVKPAEITTGTTQLFLELVEKILPYGVLKGVRCQHETVAQLIAHSSIAAVTLTGSTTAGKKVAQICGENLKKCVLELGGSDAYVVFRDADVNWSVQQCVQARLVNYGQSCIAAKRFFIAREQWDQFTKLLFEQIQNLPTRVLAHKKFQSQIHEQVEKLKNIGGKVIIGGQMPLGVDASYPITVIEFTQYHSSLGAEEIFGPVFCLIPFDDEDAVFVHVNESPFGLGAALFTQRTAQAQIWAETKLQVGMVAINEQLKSDPRLPFGGVKSSGFGRELSIDSLSEFANQMTIVGRDS